MLSYVQILGTAQFLSDYLTSSSVSTQIERHMIELKSFNCSNFIFTHNNYNKSIPV